MTLTHWLTFLLASILIAVSPGSGAVLSMSHGLSYGVRKTTGTIFGLQLGLLLLLVVAGAGVGSLLIASEIAFNIVKTVGALYLIYLGFNQWRAKVMMAPELQENLRHARAEFAQALLAGVLHQCNQSQRRGVYGSGAATVHRQGCAFAATVGDPGCDDVHY